MSSSGKYNKRRAIEKITEFFDIPSSVLPWGMDFEIKSDREVYVDGCTGILEYSDEKVVFVGKGMRMAVMGEDFKLYTFANAGLRLCGKVTKVEIERF